MEKLIYVAWKRSEDGIAEFRERLLDEACPAMLEAGVRALGVGVADVAAGLGERAILVMGRGREISGAVTLWLDCLDERAPIEAALRGCTARLAGYLVTESVPQARAERDWADGQASPGVTHFTAFPKPAAVSDEDFYAAWQGKHTPLSFQLHPLRTEYVRNAVARVLTADSPPYRAIVEERFGTLEDYADPARLFGPREIVARMLDELPEFADVAEMDALPMTEIILRS